MNRLRFALGQQGQRGAPPQIARFHSLNSIFALGQRDILRPLVPGAIPLAGPRKAKQIQPLPRCPSCPLCIWHWDSGTSSVPLSQGLYLLGAPEKPSKYSHCPAVPPVPYVYGTYWGT